MCDIGRYSYKEEDSSSLILKGWVREDSGTKEMGTPELLGLLAQGLKGLKGKAEEAPVAVLVAPDRTNEEMFAICAFMAEVFGSSRVVLDVPAPKGPKDDLLLTGEMASNSRGLSLFASRSAKPYTIDAFKQDLEAGKLEAVMLFGDTWEGLKAAWPGMQEAFKALRTLAMFTSKRKALFSEATFVIPSASMIQKDGTWVNVTGHVQRVRKAYRLNQDILADNESLGLLAEFMGESFQVGKLEDITRRFLEVIAGLSGASLADVGLEGVSLPSEEQAKHLEA
jgi:predicted molibdopterin-dependent oxidoreductase YjgC